MALATGTTLLAAEVVRLGRERDAARREFDALVARLTDRPSTALAPAAPPEISHEPTYLSDLAYHDSLWDEQFVQANEDMVPEGTDQ